VAVIVVVKRDAWIFRADTLPGDADGGTPGIQLCGHLQNNFQPVVVVISVIRINVVPHGRCRRTVFRFPLVVVGGRRRVSVREGRADGRSLRNTLPVPVPTLPFRFRSADVVTLRYVVYGRLDGNVTVTVTVYLT